MELKRAAAVAALRLKDALVWTLAAPLLALLAFAALLVIAASRASDAIERAASGKSRFEFDRDRYLDRSGI